MVTVQSVERFGDRHLARFKKAVGAADADERNRGQILSRLRQTYCSGHDKRSNTPAPRRRFSSGTTQHARPTQYNGGTAVVWGHYRAVAAPKLLVDREGAPAGKRLMSRGWEAEWGALSYGRRLPSLRVVRFIWPTKH
jgi:hypothetical protein